MMRIITGKARGVRLETLPGDATRPTAEKVKEAIFSSLAQDVCDRRVLDLFAGSGQLSLEALSRGAQSALMCDSSPEACAVIRKNMEKTRLGDMCTLRTLDAKKLLKSLAGEKYDLIFLDPPYKLRLIPSLLDMIVSLDLVPCGGIIVCEDEIEQPYSIDGFRLRKHGKYGRIFISILEKESNQ